MRFWTPKLVAVVLLGCGAQVGGGRGPKEASGQEDGAVALARMLPTGADRCVVARPGRLSDRRRSLLVRLSQSDAFAWAAGLDISAYALAQKRIRHDLDLFEGADPRVTLLRGTRQLRKELNGASPFRLAWSEGRCPGRHCLRARELDAQTVRVTRGTFRHGDRRVLDRCVALASRHAEAAEVATWRETYVSLSVQPVERFVDVVLRTDARGVVLTETRDLRGVMAADAEVMAAAEVALRRELVEAERAQVSFHDGRLVAVTRYAWEDLVLLREDDLGRGREGEETACALDDVGDVARVRRVLDVCKSQLARSPGRAHVIAMEQYRALLTRVVEAHPAHLDLARDLAEMLVRDLRAGEHALALIRRTLERDPPDREGWLTLERRAAARIGEEALAHVLVTQGLEEAGRARGAAGALLSLLRDDVDYALAEQAYFAGRILEGVLDRARVHVPSAALALEALPETLAVLGARQGPPHGELELLVRAESPRPFLPGPAGAPFLRMGERGLFFAAARTNDREALWAIGDFLVDMVGDGEVAVAVAYEDAQGERSRPYGLRGRAVDGALVLSHVSRQVARRPWARVARYLTAPLATLDRRLFPPPVLRIEAETERVAEILFEVQRGTGARCVRDGAVIECTAPLDLSEAEALETLYAALERMAEERLGGGRAKPRP